MIIELDSTPTIKKHANLWHSTHNQIRRRFGNKFEYICRHPDGGTVKTESGEGYDYFVNRETREVIFYPAQ